MYIYIYIYNHGVLGPNSLFKDMNSTATNTAYLFVVQACVAPGKLFGLSDKRKKWCYIVPESLLNNMTPVLNAFFFLSSSCFTGLESPVYSILRIDGGGELMDLCFSEYL